MKFIVAFLLLAIICLARAQFEDGGYSEEDMPQQPPHPQQGQQIQMTQEIIEALWELLTPQCKTEMESALGSQGDISMECKIEVQGGLIQLGVMQDPRGQQQQQQQQQGSANGREEQQRSAPRAQQEPADNTPPVESAEMTGTKMTTIASILGLVAILFGAAIAYVIYHNQNQPAKEVKQKKLSKQKVSYHNL